MLKNKIRVFFFFNIDMTKQQEKIETLENHRN